ncbi:hypothetical protein ACEWY4_014869 [Coilia grayii]|uniref:C2H2-type domain-containing protein n=1 Tax=Coilia grayii TaxID=363190 RepID=A0ABD1JTJ8_9TELE
MASKDALRRQRRRELDARRSKSRVRLGPCLPHWGKLKDSLGFSLHSELAQYLLDSYFSKVHQTCLCSQKESAITASVETLHRLVVQVHTHSQRCPHPPSLQQSLGTTRATPCQGQRQSAGTESELGSCGLENGAVSTPVGLTEPGEALFGEISLSFVCKDGHVLSWCPKLPGKERMEGEVGGMDRGVGPPRDPPQGEAIKAGREGADGNSGMRTRSRRGAPQTMSPRHPARGVEEGTAEQSYSSHTSQEGHTEEGSTTVEPRTGSDDMETESPEAPQHRTAATTSPTEINTDPRGRTGKAHPSTHTTRRGSRSDRTSLLKDEVPHTGNKRKSRKTNPKEMFLCTYEGCEKIFSSRQYLNHHMKYQHVQQKTFSCSHPSCGKSFNFKKHLKEHEKLHSNQRDYICEFCARAFRTNSNLLTHRRIHTGEKPLQCEVCGFTCSQKASLNWHMRKHNAESGYRFPCDICGRRFEKRDNVTAHRSKSHPDHSVSVPSVPPAPPAPPIPASPLPPIHTSPSPLTHTSPSPPTHTSPSPPTHTSPSPPTHTSPSPLTHTSPSPLTHTSPSSPTHTSPSPLDLASPSPPVLPSPSPLDLASPSPPVLPSPSPPDLASPLPSAEPAHDCP